jgi:hypothetical protein
MPNQRAPGQKLINVPIDVAFIKIMDVAARAAGYDNRAEFIRDAIYEKLSLMNIEVPESIRNAPSRMGKGGRPPKIKIIDSKTGLPVSSDVVKL